MKGYAVYVLWSNRLGKRYIGCTADLQKRVKQHNEGKQRFTKGGIPWDLIYSEECANLKEARNKELLN